MAAVTGTNISSPRLATRPLCPFHPQPQSLGFPRLSRPWRIGGRAPRSMRPVAAAPERIEEKVAESIKEAEEKCSENPVSGECAAAWDEVEELSAAASHARDRNKDSDPLENYCKDNPETEECRTYDN
ncbi:CP12 domain-containing protein [Psidium guajava]|nr:CP12 domain-containing protein [Psidium guajava]